MWRSRPCVRGGASGACSVGVKSRPRSCWSRLPTPISSTISSYAARSPMLAPSWPRWTRPRSRRSCSTTSSVTTWPRLRRSQTCRWPPRSLAWCGGAKNFTLVCRRNAPQARSQGAPMARNNLSPQEIVEEWRDAALPEEDPTVIEEQRDELVARMQQRLRETVVATHGARRRARYFAAFGAIAACAALGFGAWRLRQHQAGPALATVQSIEGSVSVTHAGQTRS